MDESRLEQDFPAQLRQIILVHLITSNLGAQQVADAMDVWLSTAQSMLVRSRWSLNLCCQLAEALGIEVELTAVAEGERAVDQALEAVSGAASVELGRLIASR